MNVTVYKCGACGTTYNYFYPPRCTCSVLAGSTNVCGCETFTKVDSDNDNEPTVKKQETYMDRPPLL